MERRSIQNQEHLGASLARFLSGHFKPSIFTNEQTQFDASHFKHTSLVARREVTALVEHLIIWQFLLGVGGNDPPLS